MAAFDIGLDTVVMLGGDDLDDYERPVDLPEQYPVALLHPTEEQEVREEVFPFRLLALHPDTEGGAPGLGLGGHPDGGR